MCRVGKIARLPRAIRDQLNHRLSDGEIGAKLVPWLNNLPEVQKVMTDDFGGRPITEQNLSEWRQGGFEDWLRHEDARTWAAQIAEESDDLAKDSDPIALYDRAAYPALLALTRPKTNKSRQSRVSRPPRKLQPLKITSTRTARQSPSPSDQIQPNRTSKISARRQPGKRSGKPLRTASQPSTPPTLSHSATRTVRTPQRART